MIQKNIKKKYWIKKVLFITLILLVTGILTAWYLFTKKFDDTKKEVSSFSVNAIDLIKEFQTSDSTANKKYIEKIMTIKGSVTETEIVDSVVNIKMSDTLINGSILFAFQQQNIADTKSIKVGDIIAIKGSCSGGVYSEILESEIINFKRCLIINNK